MGHSVERKTSARAERSGEPRRECATPSVSSSEKSRRGARSADLVCSPALRLPQTSATAATRSVPVSLMLENAGVLIVDIPIGFITAEFLSARDAASDTLRNAGKFQEHLPEGK